MWFWNDRHLPMKKVIYLYKSGQLKTRDYSLVLIEKNLNVIYLPIEQIDTIICFGEVSLNKRTLSLLNKHKITLLFFNYYGQLIGRFLPKRFYDGKILINQINAYNNYDTRRYIAIQIITASLKNCLALLKYYNKKGIELQEKINTIELIVKNCYKQSIDQLLISEAGAKKIYYSCFDLILKNKDFKFDKRSKNPPENEINAMISYGYAILYGNYISVIDRSRLYSQISFIHSISKNSESLQFDLADIMKPVIVDRLILSICRRDELKKTYFCYNGKRCYLNKEGIKFFVEKYENNISRTIKINNRYYSYRNLISREVHALSNYLAKESDEYKPYVMKW